MRYRLRTLLIVAAFGPVVLALTWWCSVLVYEAKFRRFNAWEPVWKTNIQGRDVLQEE